MSRLVEIRHTVSPELFRDMKPADLKKYLGEAAYDEGVKQLAKREVQRSRPTAEMYDDFGNP